MSALATILRSAPTVCIAQAKRRGLHIRAFSARQGDAAFAKGRRTGQSCDGRTDVMRMSAGVYGGRNDCAYPSRLLRSSRCLPSRAAQRATRAIRARRDQGVTRAPRARPARRVRPAMPARWGRPGRRDLPGQSAPPGLRGRRAMLALRVRQGRPAPQERSARQVPRGRPAMQARSAQPGPLAPPDLRDPKERRDRPDLRERLANHRMASSARLAPRGRPDCLAPRAIRVPPGRPGRILFFE